MALKKNISCLYKTAKSEIERKDREIAELRKRLAVCYVVELLCNNLIG
jgi:hypothetical protein